jgi:peroxiredoxin-like protein
MEAFPHHYSVKAVAQEEGPVSLTGQGLPEICSAPPAQFGGPGDKWSPEDLLVSSVADCFILTFRAIAKASRVEWSDLQCSAEGVLDRVERVNRFTEFTVRATLTVPAGTDPEKAKNLLQKAEASCLITNSLDAEMHLEAEVLVSP